MNRFPFSPTAKLLEAGRETFPRAVAWFTCGYFLLLLLQMALSAHTDARQGRLAAAAFAAKPSDTDVSRPALEGAYKQ